MSKQNVVGVKNVIGNLDNIRNISIIAHIDSGKCFGKGTPIMMSDGSTKYVEDIKDGDYVMGHNMKAGHVSNMHSGTDKMYLIDQNDDGLSYSVNSKHIMVFQLIQDHMIEYNETENTATLYYFEENSLQQVKRTKNGFFDKILINLKLAMVQTTRSFWVSLHSANKDKIAGIGSWLYIPIEEYVKYPEYVKYMLRGVQMDWQHYNETGRYQYSLTDIKVTQNSVSEYYGFEVKSNPLFMLSDGTIVHNSTLSDSLVTKAGFIAAKKAGQECVMDTREDEAARGITIKSCSVSLHHNVPDHVMPLVEAKQKTNGSEFLINLIDSPGHVDFSSEVTAALRVTDGAVCVVECIGGVSVQTETVVRQAIQENIEMVLMINKVDRAIVEQQLEPEVLYQRFYKIIQDMNVLLNIYGGERYEDEYFNPLKGNVVFGAAYHGWAFSLRHFAEMYSRVNNMEISKITKRLWGEYFVDSKGKWSKTNQSGKRGFVKMVLDPIYMVYEIETKKTPTQPIIDKVAKLGIKLEKKDIEDQTDKEILRAIMRKWIPAGDAVLEMVIEHLPSPKTAQKYRGKELYTGDLDSEVGQAIINCDPNGPMTMFVSKMFPANDNRFYAFGRVFSGTIHSGQKVKIMGGNYTYGEKTDLVEGKNIQRVVIMMVGKVEPMTEVPCGNIVGLVGIDQYMTKTGTLSSVDAHPIRPMRYSVSPVVQVAVEPNDVKDIAKLQAAMKKLAKSDPLVHCYTSDTGENIIAGAGELHVEICIHDLKELAGVDIRTSEPIVPYCETILHESSVMYAKSSSGLNRILMKAQPVAEDMVKDIDSGDLKLNTTAKDLVRHCIDKYQFDVTDFKRLWGFGGEEATQTNVLTDDSKGVAYLDQIKGSVINSFESNVTQGVLVGEPLRGVQFKLVDAQIHGDSAHRGIDEIAPTVRKAILAGMISGKPRLVEPMYLCEIYCPNGDVGAIYGFISRRRGEIFSEEPVEGNPMTIMKCYLPVAESFGFTHKLRELTHGRAFPTCVFDHWKVIESDPYEEGTYAYNLVRQIRKRKGKPEDLPEITKFIDKMPKEFASRYES